MFTDFYYGYLAYLDDFPIDYTRSPLWIQGWLAASCNDDRSVYLEDFY